jgi:glycine/D-amino acid oxidase-like deaminating enzyme/nitrite reductase/ring-hydroxylating ferredoxin subunit
VVEAREVGAGTTGASTAKATLAQGTHVGSLADRHAADVLVRYAEATLVGQQRIRQLCEQAGVPFETTDGVSYATTPQGRAALAAEASAMAVAGVPAHLADDAPDLPFAVTGALRLPDQLQFQPQAYLDALLAEAVRVGVRVHTGTRAEGMSATGAPREVGTRSELGRGTVRAAHVVVATGTPVLDRSGFFARLEPERSLCVAVRVRGERPPGMYLSVDSPTRSLRRSSAVDDVLVVGGNGFTTGRAHDVAARFADLEAWARATFDVAGVTHRWAAQDYRTPDGLPFVGRFHPWAHDVWVATGFAKWGTTTGTAAALAIAGAIRGTPPPWAADWDPWRGDVADQVPTTARLNAQVARHLVGGWSGALREPPPDPGRLAEGQGAVGREGARPVGVSRVDGHVRRVSAVCPHLGGILAWNDGEATWDCPLHGSRFAPDGTRLEGPATCGLAGLDHR